MIFSSDPSLPLPLVPISLLFHVHVHAQPHTHTRTPFRFPPPPPPPPTLTSSHPHLHNYTFTRRRTHGAVQLTLSHWNPPTTRQPHTTDHHTTLPHSTTTTTLQHLLTPLTPLTPLLPTKPQPSPFTPTHAHPRPRTPTLPLRYHNPPPSNSPSTLKHTCQQLSPTTASIDHHDHSNSINYTATPRHIHQSRATNHFLTSPQIPYRRSFFRKTDVARPILKCDVE